LVRVERPTATIMSLNAWSFL